MKILIIGGHGMAGHLIKDYLSFATQHEVWWTTRQHIPNDPKCLYLDVRNDYELKKVLALVKPNAVINAVGLLNDMASKNVIDAILINSLLPHRLSEYSYEYDFYLIHISTDCVFSGGKGEYTENDRKDGISVYAQTKSLGELTNNKNLTIRTSIIGPELKQDGIGLFHWFMAQKGEIQGYKNVFWNGITTLELAKSINKLLNNIQLTGLIHITGDKKISKYDLITLIKDKFNKNDVTILPEYNKKSDKSLKITRKDAPYSPVDYTIMINELKQWIEVRPDIYQIYFR